ncbi:RagB/SusD family nutrient uptake outer membrane protein [Pedobacter sp. LMG 31464]|uniref:RagB/SusD family nutrient uptake outer membrane protein n=1 Tax=Pedobacter planticolens TaxID=2679964 RepID=A0A923DVH4_9SPHI|nr:RagB/SusD family nutrient uptake outer membrane protein [Pedobacter planticolens]MBB2144696.1 RagB/SusD family nutrient uptake outer membrane protein [Pedobacter planticolens]
MKKILIGFAAILLSTAFSACNKLQLAPEDSYGSENFWKNSAQVDGAMIGLHSQLRGYQFTFFNLGELRGGSLKTGTSFTGTASLNAAGLIAQDIRESSPGVSGWVNFYRPIFDVNNFIYQVEKSTYLTAADKGYYLGQAYGLRAFYYFWLFRTYGRVPLTTEPSVLLKDPKSAADLYLARSATEKQTLDFIKADIDKSATSFNGNYTTKFQKAQWGLSATQMLKGEVYLWSAKVKMDGAAPTSTAADLATSRTALEDVISKHTLLANFGNVFKSASIAASRGSSEIIFALRNLSGEASNNYSQFIYAITDPLSGYVDDQGNAIPSADPLQVNGGGTIIRYEYKIELYDQFQSTDSRKNATFLNFNKASAGIRATNLRKFPGEIVTGARVFSDDFPVYRVAEAYLLLAEVKNKQGQDPTAEIMMVRNRAYAPNAAPLFVNGTFEQNELAIFAERGKEFVGEGKRWFDLRRMQDASGNPLVFRKDLPLVGVLDNVAGQNHKILWPIDIGTLNADELLKGNQNPGYPGT